MGVFSLTDSKQVLTVGEDSTVRLWNIDKPKTASKILRKHEGKVTFGDFDPQNQNQILTVGVDGKGYIWDATTGNVIHELNGHSGQINFALFNPKKNLSQILTVSKDKTARIWSLANTAVFETPQNERLIYTIFSSQNKDELLSVDRDGTIKGWNFNTSKYRIIAQLSTKKDSITNASLNPNNSNQIALVNINGQIEIWDIDKPSQPTFRLPKRDDNAKTIKFSSKNSNLLLALNDNGVITIYNLQKPKLEPTILSAYPNLISSGAFDPSDPNRVLTTTNKGEFIVWNIQNFNDPIEYSRKSVGDVTLWNGAFDPLDIDRVLVTGSDNFGGFYNLKSMEKENIQLEQNGTVTNASFSSSQKNQFLTISQRESDRLSKISLWNLEFSGQPIMIIEDFSSEVEYATFSSNMNNMLTVSKSGNVKVYTLDNKDIVKLGWQSRSRCLNEDEISSSNITDIYSVNNILKYVNVSTPTLMNKKYYSYCE